MTTVHDPELGKWLDHGDSLDCMELRLKDGAPEEIKIKFEKWKKERDDYQKLWRKNKN